VGRGEEKPLAGLLAADPILTELLPPDRILALLDAGDYVGEAPQRARALAEIARKITEK
jgi:capsid portal protein